jgi:HD-GYP domain-containing protein (c-di-GMP phosphodiesterase class II)
VHRSNVYGPSGTFRRLSLADILNGDYPPEFFRNRFVLVGLTAAGIVDEVATPFSQNRNRMPGIEVHANTLENLLDGTMIREVGDGVRWLAFLAATLLLAFCYRRLHEIPATVLCALAVTAMPALSFTLFVMGNLWLPPALFAAAFIAVYIVTYLLRLDAAARTLDRKHAALMDHLGPPATEIHPQKAGGLAGYLTEAGIESKVARLLKVEQRYETILEETVQQRTQELSSALSLLNRVSDEMIIRLTKAVESRDEGTGDHVLRVGLYAREMAKYLQMPEEFIDCLTFASAMHDIGKIGIPDHVLLKPDHLTDEEMSVMKTHCLIGHRILSESPYPKLQMSAVIALTHHERWDGAGYPAGLSGEDIPLETRIFVIGDCYDALRSQRHYKPAWSHEKSCAALLEAKAGQFDPRMLEAFSVIAPSFADIFDSHPNRTPAGNSFPTVH